ncbi:MAG: isoprenylcysteine carboxylmethyltransferase family protein [Terracidiphilus sp.]|jgi:protein-S-isoprenylcysteine O-methyltransferase Ste14
MPAAQSSTTAGLHSSSKRSLGARIIVRFFLGLIAALVILFVPAGALNFWQGWVFLAILFFPSLVAYAYFWKHDPQLLERRMQNKEQISEQKLLIRLSGPLFIIAFLLPGLDHRFGWSRDSLGNLPLWLAIVSEATVLASILFIAWVMNVNRYAARTIQVEAGQKVITTGPYRFVRHPLYAGSAALWFFTPPALGSWVAWPAFVLLLPFYVIRLLNEEKVLRAQLAGYPEYCQRTRYRLIPFVW